MTPHHQKLIVKYITGTEKPPLLVFLAAAQRKQRMFILWSAADVAVPQLRRASERATAHLRRTKVYSFKSVNPDHTR